MRSEALKDLIKLENPELEVNFNAGNSAYKKYDRYEQLISHMEFYLKELKRTGVNKRLLWEEYRQQNRYIAYSYGYSQFCWHLQQYQHASPFYGAGTQTCRKAFY
ncbi:MAG: hypothetical protein RIA69_02795 [Cyclobacteriaceae bacterium]